MLKPFKSKMALTASTSDRNGCDRLPRGLLPLTPVKHRGRDPVPAHHEPEEHAPSLQLPCALHQGEQVCISYCSPNPASAKPGGFKPN